jgi:hypothetical protein
MEFLSAYHEYPNGGVGLPDQRLRGASLYVQAEDEVLESSMLRLRSTLRRIESDLQKDEDKIRAMLGSTTQYEPLESAFQERIEAEKGAR